MTLKSILALLQVAILAAGMALLGTLMVETFERSIRADADQRAAVGRVELPGRRRAEPAL